MTFVVTITSNAHAYVAFLRSGVEEDDLPDLIASLANGLQTGYRIDIERE